MTCSLNFKVTHYPRGTRLAVTARPEYALAISQERT